MECASRAWEPGCGCGRGTGLTFWSWPPGATGSTPPPAQERLPAGAARGGPVGGGGLERGPGRREQAGGVRVQSAGLGAPAAPSWRALCPGSPRQGQRMHQAGLAGSPAWVPGRQGAALALGVPVRGGGARALDERESSGIKLLPWWEGPGPPARPCVHPVVRTRATEGSPAYLKALGWGGPPARAGLAPQAPQEVAQVEEVLGGAGVQTVPLQVHLEALARQNDGGGQRAVLMMQDRANFPEVGEGWWGGRPSPAPREEEGLLAESV